MVIYCSADGTQHPDEANYCMKCGQPLRAGVARATQRPMQWEYKDLDVPLNLKLDHGHSEASASFQQAFNGAVLSALQRAGHDGWQADGPTDFHSLSAAGAIPWRTEGMWYPGIRYLSATIRLKRLVPA